MILDGTLKDGEFKTYKDMGNGWVEEIDTNKTIKAKLIKENIQLKEKLNCDLQWAFKYEKQVDNWNKLREYIGTEWYCFDNESAEFEIAKDILDKMQELEQGSYNQ